MICGNCVGINVQKEHKYRSVLNHLRHDEEWWSNMSPQMVSESHYDRAREGSWCFVFLGGGLFCHIHLNNSEFRVTYRLQEGWKLSGTAREHHHSKPSLSFTANNQNRIWPWRWFFTPAWPEFLQSFPKVKTHPWTIIQAISVLSDGKSNPLNTNKCLSVRELKSF